ncbi:MAG: glycine zipper family protein [Paracoccaceae bacterium]
MRGALAALVLLAGCAGHGADYAPVLDGPPGPAFAADLTACQSLARAQAGLDREAAAAAIAGAVAGAALGAEDGTETAVAGLAVGALAGLVGGADLAAERRREIVVVCLQGRGHRAVG